MQEIYQIKRTTVKCFFILLLLLPGQVLADNSGVMAQEEGLGLFQEIPSVFSASKYDQKVTEAPSSISIITADEIRKAGYRTLTEILASVRGFYVYTDHNYDYVGIRGLGRPGDYNSRLLLLVDDHRVNDETYSSAPIGRDFLIDVDLIDRIEIVRGPSSSLYGTSAFFGVINVFTKSGRDYKGVEATASVSKNDLISGRLSYGQKWKNGFELLLSGTSTQSDGDDWYFKEFDDPYYNNGRAEGIDEQKDYNLFLKAEHDGFNLTMAYNKMEDGYPTAPWGTEFNNPDSVTLDEFFYADLSYEFVTDSDLEISARLFYDYYYFEGVYPYDWADYEADPDSDPYIINGYDFVESERWGTSLQIGKTFWGKHRVLLGGEYRDGFKQDQDYYNYHSRTVDSDYDYIVSHPLDSSESSSTLGLYIQDEIRIDEELILNIGARLDDYSTFGNAFNPRLALIYNPRDTTTMKFLYGSAFRAPSSYELYYQDGGETMLANPDLDPEEITTYEVVWEEQLAKNVKTVVNPYYYEIEELITQETVYVDDWPLLIFNNADKIEGYGIEVEVEGKFLDKVTARLSYSYQKTEDSKTGEELSNSPKHLGKLSINVPVWKDIVILNLEELYTGSALTVDRDERLDASWVTNLTLSAADVINGLDLSLTAKNLFDEHYETPGFGEHLQKGLEQPGRNIVFKASYSF